jgi:hypothetical protein
MRALFAFVKKELTEQARSGKLLFMTILFVLLGIMNPAIAKLTPWLLETMADSLADSGMTDGRDGQRYGLLGAVFQERIDGADRLCADAEQYFY